MYKGFFITLEGVDGTGKSTQIKFLSDAMLRMGKELYVTKEPGDSACGSNVGAGVRSLLFKDPGTKNVGPGVGDLLFLADHVQNTYDIRERLHAGKVVISDRYADSQFAYAAAGSKKAPAWANKLFELQYGPTPDLIILFVVRGSLITEGPLAGMEDISWALTRANSRRGVEADKQAGKAWNDSEEQRKIQEAYLFNLQFKTNVFYLHVWDYFTPAMVHEKILMEVINRMAERNVKQPVLPMYDHQVA